MKKNEGSERKSERNKGKWKTRRKELKEVKKNERESARSEENKTMKEWMKMKENIMDSYIENE